MSLAFNLALSLISWASKHEKFGRPEVYYTAKFVKSQEDCSPATMREFNDGASFFRYFEGSLSPKDITGKSLLDLGCGYGGRTAFYLLKGDPAKIVGLETTVEKIHIATNSVDKLCPDQRISFQVGVGEELPFENSSFDLIFSYDVFEHVQDLPKVLKECVRVLKPGGKVYALFPPYYGPRSHHLDFITSLPFLHHLFSPDTLVKATNSILEKNPEYGVKPLPEPKMSYLGRKVLPNLNGTTIRDFQNIISNIPFAQTEIKLLPFAWPGDNLIKRVVKKFCEIMLKTPLPKDIFVSSIRCTLTGNKGE